MWPYSATHFSSTLCTQLECSKGDTTSSIIGRYQFRQKNSKLATLLFYVAQSIPSLLLWIFSSPFSLFHLFLRSVIGHQSSYWSKLGLPLTVCSSNIPLITNSTYLDFNFHSFIEIAYGMRSIFFVPHIRFCILKHTSIKSWLTRYPIWQRIRIL